MFGELQTAADLQRWIEEFFERFEIKNFHQERLGFYCRDFFCLIQDLPKDGWRDARSEMLAVIEGSSVKYFSKEAALEAWAIEVLHFCYEFKLARIDLGNDTIGKQLTWEGQAQYNLLTSRLRRAKMRGKDTAQLEKDLGSIKRTYSRKEVQNQTICTLSHLFMSLSPKSGLKIRTQFQVVSATNFPNKTS